MNHLSHQPRPEPSPDAGQPAEIVDAPTSIEVEMAAAAEPAEEAAPPPDSPEVVAAKAEATRITSEFIVQNGEIVANLLGIRGVRMRVGKGWATYLESGEVTADPSFFVERGYGPEHCVYATLHEFSAHLKEVITEPALTREVMAFSRRGDAYATFHNIISDIAGNNETHRRLPVMGRVGADLYARNLFPGQDYTHYNPGLDPEGRAQDKYGEPIPRHMQFLDSIIRSEMIPGSSTVVLPEVDHAIAELRNFNGTGQDAIKVATDPKKKPRERYELMLGLILPVYLRLLEEDKKDPNFQNGGQSRPGEGQSGEGDSKDGKPASGQPGKGHPFGSDYKFMDDKHPDPLTPSQERQIRREAERARKNDSPEGRAKRAAELQTGHSMSEIQEYRGELMGRQAEIARMQEFFNKIISRRLATVRRLARPQQEGVLLDPALLAQTHMDVRSGISDPPTFLDYETKHQSERLVGGYDMYLVIDTSGTMAGDRAKMAAISSLIFTEGLNLFEQSIRETEQLHNVDLGLDVQTEVYAFGSGADKLKPLSPTLNEKQRLDTYATTKAAAGGSTADYLALKQIADEYEERLLLNPNLAERKKIIVVATDGGSDNPTEASAQISRLRRLGFRVIAIGIEAGRPIDPDADADADAAPPPRLVSPAEGLYAPDGRTITDPSALPDTLIGIIETEVTE